MSEPRLSPSTKALLRAARSDGPNAAARAKVWSAVAGSIGAGAGAAGAAGSSAAAGSNAALAGGASAAKMLAIGTLLGGTVVVGLASVLLGIGPIPRVPPAHGSTPERIGAGAMAPAPMGHVEPVADLAAEREAVPVVFANPLAAVAPVTIAPAVSVPAGTGIPMVQSARAPYALVPQKPDAPSAAHPVPTAASPGPDDLLVREATLVVAAREALVRGDPQTALRNVKAARTLPSHRLAPEELSIESQALRALGREADARDADSTLKKQFPESALAR